MYLNASFLTLLHPTLLPILDMNQGLDLTNQAHGVAGYQFQRFVSEMSFDGVSMTQ